MTALSFSRRAARAVPERLKPVNPSRRPGIPKLRLEVQERHLYRRIFPSNPAYIVGAGERQECVGEQRLI